MTKNEINVIYNNLLNNYTYSDKNNFSGFKLGYCKIKQHLIIRYNHFGSSAIKFNKTNLKWMIKNIFDNDISKLEPKQNGCIYY